MIVFDVFFDHNFICFIILIIICSAERENGKEDYPSTLDDSEILN